MAKTLEKHTSQNEFFIVPKGTVVSMANPAYNKDDPSTHENIMVQLDEDVGVCTMSRSDVITGNIVTAQ